MQACWTASWFGKKKPPSLNEILGKKEVKNKKMTNEEMLEEIKKLNASLGGTTY